LQAAVGWPTSELFDRNIANAFGLKPLLLDAASDRVPAALNGGLDRVSPVFWGFCLGLTAAIDLYGVEIAQRSRSTGGDSTTYFPGKLGFDPLNLYPADQEGRKRMDLAEVKHGRVAMLAITGYAVQEWSTKLGVVDETPFFFSPIVAVSF